MNEKRPGPRARATIFDSTNEKELFGALSGVWEPTYKLYPHVPFESLVDVGASDLETAELEFLHKTTVDYALATADGQPLFGIEFDGLGHGFTRNGRYIQKVPTVRDKHRAWKLNLKARVADAAQFPLVVLSYDEKTVLDEGANLTIAHGIIGQFVARLHVEYEFNDLVENKHEYLEGASEPERDELLQDTVYDAELIANLKWNPIQRRSAQLMEEHNQIEPLRGGGWRFLHDPPQPPEAVIDFSSPNFNLSAHQAWWGSLQRLGVEAWVDTSRGRVTRTVWVRNLDSRWLSVPTLADDVAELVVRLAAVELLRSSKRETP